MPLDQKPVPAKPAESLPGTARTAENGPVPAAGSGRAAETAPWSVRGPGPWTHRDVAANGARFHVAEVGEGPLVLLVHGWPEYWWAWRHQMTALAEAGFRAVALDLRGVGGSDRTPAVTTPATWRSTSPA